MASEEARKKWGTIFMGEREASVEQLNAMQEHVNRDRLQKEQTQDYLERVKARAVERAREILGEAYTERQKVLEEAKGEAAVQKRLAAQDCAKIKAEGEAIRQKAQDELAAAQAERDKAVQIRESAYAEGYEEGMHQAGAELQEFRAELGQALSALLRSIERERRTILENWRSELAELVKVAVQAGTGIILNREHEAVLRQLVFDSLDLLENRSAISVRVNPQDEETVSDMFRAARERVPELKQWTVTGDEAIEQGGLVAESGTGSVDLKRANFREMVDNVLAHLGLPELESEAKESENVARLVEQEVAHIASLTPEPELPEQEMPQDQQGQATSEEADSAEAQSVPEESAVDEATAEKPLEPISEELADMEDELTGELASSGAPATDAETVGEEVPEAEQAPSLAELEDELFPLEEPASADQPDSGQQPDPGQKNEQLLDQKTLTEGGFL